jgi:putative transposase
VPSEPSVLSATVEEPPLADGEVASPTTTRRRRTPAFVCELPLRVGPAEQRMLQARLEAARALYNACLGEARTRGRLVRQSRAYQHARTLPKKTPERTAAIQAARTAHGFTEADLQGYAKDCRNQSHWIAEHLDAPVSQKLAPVPIGR